MIRTQKAAEKKNWEDNYCWQLIIPGSLFWCRVNPIIFINSQQMWPIVDNNKISKKWKIVNNSQGLSIPGTLFWCGMLSEPNNSHPEPCSTPHSKTDEEAKSEKLQSWIVDSISDKSIWQPDSWWGLQNIAWPPQPGLNQAGELLSPDSGVGIPDHNHPV